MSTVVPLRETSLTVPSAKELATIHRLPPDFEYFVNVPKNFLSELRDAYALLRYMHMSLRVNGLQWPCSPNNIASFLGSDFYLSLREQVEEQKAVGEDDAEVVVKVIISTHTLQQNVSPQVLAEVFMEIIRELKPSKLALHFARVSLRNNNTFVPAPREFRDKLIQAIKSIASLAEAVLCLSEKLNAYQEQICHIG